MITSPAGIPPQTPSQQQQPEKHSTLKFIVIGHGALSILLLLVSVVIFLGLLISNKRLTNGETGAILNLILFSCCWCSYIIYCLVVPVIGSFADNKVFFLVHTIGSFLLVLIAFGTVFFFGYILATTNQSEEGPILLICLILIWIIEGIASVAGGIASGMLFRKMNEAERTQAPAVCVVGGSPAQQTSPSYPQVVNGVPVYQNNI